MDGVKGASGSPEVLCQIMYVCAGRKFINLISYSKGSVTKTGLELLVSVIRRKDAHTRQCQFVAEVLT